MIYHIGDEVNVGFVVHNPDTGLPVDADATPTFIVFESESDVVIITGDCEEARGYYKANFLISEENGFLNNKSYAVAVVAIVNTNTSIKEVYTFKVQEYDLNEETITAIANEVVNVIEGEGSNLVVVSVMDNLGSPVPNMRLTVKNSDLSATLGKADTNSNGIASFGLIDGEYKIIISTISGYSTNNPYTLIVSGDTSLNCEVNKMTEADPNTVVTLHGLITKLRQYIGDEGETVNRSVIGLPDGNRVSFLLHHNSTSGVSVFINGQLTAVTQVKNKITFATPPAIRSAITAEYTYYEYSNDILSLCILKGIGYLENAIDLGWGELSNEETWEVTCDYSIEDVILTAAVLEFLSMQIVRLPIAISFGDIGSRISLRGASSEREKAIKQLRESLTDKINKVIESDLDFYLIPW